MYLYLRIHVQETKEVCKDRIKNRALLSVHVEITGRFFTSKQFISQNKGYKIVYSQHNSLYNFYYISHVLISEIGQSCKTTSNCRSVLVTLNNLIRLKYICIVSKITNSRKENDYLISGTSQIK